MKYLRGYIVAAVFLVLTLALTAFAAAHTTLVDMVYPYASRLIQSSLAQWVSGIDICLWQLIVVLMGALLTVFSGFGIILHGYEGEKSKRNMAVLLMGILVAAVGVLLCYI